MKTLLLMRHAKSCWDDLYLRDFDRPLSNRGRRAAIRMGQWIKENNLIPDQIISSAAKRCQLSAELVSEDWDETVPTEAIKGLYMASPYVILSRLAKSPNTTNCLMLLNHEPAISALAELLAKKPVNSRSARAFAKFSTAGIAQFTLTLSSWSELQIGCGTFTDFTRPKDLDPDL